MKRSFLILALVAFVAFVTPISAYAATGLAGSNPTVPQGKVIHDDVYVAGSTVTVNGRIDGNLIVAGSNVTINGVVTGTVLAAAGNITVNGAVDNSVIATGGQMTVYGTVRHDVSFGGGALTLERGATVGRDVSVAAGTATIDGHVTRNVETRAGATTVGTAAFIGGHLGYSGNTQPTVSSGATVQGRILHRAGNNEFSNPISSAPWNTGLSIIGWLQTLVGLLLFGLLIVWLFPRLARRVTARLQEHAGSSIGWGALTLVSVPILALATFIVGLIVGGWWLSFMALAIYWIGIMLGLTFAAVLIGRLLVRAATHREEALWVSLVVGLVILLAVSVIPVLGGLTMFLATLWGLGGLVAAIYQWLRGRPGEAAAVPPVTTSPSQAAM